MSIFVRSQLHHILLLNFSKSYLLKHDLIFKTMSLTAFCFRFSEGIGNLRNFISIKQGLADRGNEISIPGESVHVNNIFLGLPAFQLFFFYIGNILISLHVILLIRLILVFTNKLSWGNPWFHSSAKLGRSRSDIDSEWPFWKSSILGSHQHCWYTDTSWHAHTWNLLMSLGLPAFFKQFWLHFMKNLRKNLQREKITKKIIKSLHVI